MFPKVPQSSLGILRVSHLPPPLEHPALKNTTIGSKLPFFSYNTGFCPEWSSTQIVGFFFSTQYQDVPIKGGMTIPNNKKFRLWHMWSRWWFRLLCFIFIHIWGRFPFWLTYIFQMGWFNHQPVVYIYILYTWIKVSIWYECVSKYRVEHKIHRFFLSKVGPFRWVSSTLRWLWFSEKWIISIVVTFQIHQFSTILYGDCRERVFPFGQIRESILYYFVLFHWLVESMMETPPKGPNIWNLYKN